MKTLKLTLKKKWFDMILFGQKREEYREIKGYWVTRLCTKHPASVIAGGDLMNKHTGTQFTIANFDRIEFTNGYNKKSPKVILECKGIEIGIGNTGWGAIENEQYFVIKLGPEVERRNC